MEKPNDNNSYISHRSSYSGISGILRQPPPVKISRMIPDKITNIVEMYKYGRALNSLTKRWAILIRDVGLFSSKEPDVTKFNKSKSKDKTNFLLNSKVKAEKLKDQKDWMNPKKSFRLIVEYIDESKKDKKNYLYLYFEDELKLNQSKEMLFAIKSMKKNEKQNKLVTTNLLSMQKLIESNYLFYGVFKLLTVKDKIKNRKMLLNSLKNKLDEELDPFVNFTRNTVSSILKNNPNINNNPNKLMNIIVPKYKFLHLNQRTDYNSTHKNRFKTINMLKSKVNLITSVFPEFFSKKIKKQNSIVKKNHQSKFSAIASLDKSVAFKITNTEFKSYNYGNYFGLCEFDGKSFKSSKLFTMNKNKIEINFNEKCSINKDDILNISNVFLNYKTSNNNSNFIILNGPKIDKNKYLKFSYKNTFLPFLAHEKFVEPDYHCMAFKQSDNTNFKSLYLQIFHCIYVFKKRDFDYLEALSEKVKFTQSTDDFYFFLSINLNEKYKLRTKLVKAKQYENERFIIEFNLEHVFNLDALLNFNPLNIRVSLNVIPVQSFGDLEINLMDENNLNFFVEYMKPYEMGFCNISQENINRRDTEFSFRKDRIILPDENKIILNFYIDEDNTYSKPESKLWGRSFYYGNEIFSLETINKKSLEPRMNDPRIDPSTKEKYYSIKFSDEGFILFRSPDPLEISAMPDIEDEEEFLTKLKDETSISQNELSGVIYNKNFKFIPHVYCENSIDIDEDIVDLESWKYKAKNIKTFLLGNFKGITENKCFVYHNYFYNEIKTTRFENIMNNPDFDKKFKPIQENAFDIYDFDQIDQSTLENGDNYLWRIGISFVNELERNAFLMFLKDFRRRANVAEKTQKILIDNPITTDILTALTKSDLQSVRSLKILIEKVEFRQNFKLNENKKMSMKVSKAFNEVNKGRYILEAFNEKDKYNYQNSLIQNREIAENLKIIQNMRQGYKILPKEYNLEMSEFNSSQKILIFGKNVELKDKMFDVEIKTGIDKLFNIEVILTGSKNTIKLFTIKNLDNIILGKPKADMFIIPLKDSETNIVYGILHAKILSEDSNENLHEKFDDLLQININNISKTEEMIVKDEYDNYLRFGKYEPNTYRRNVLRLIHNEFKTDINTLCNKEEFTNFEFRERLYNLLKRKCIKNCEYLISYDPEEYTNTLWKDLIVDLPMMQHKLMSKYYMINKRNEFYTEFAKVEWDIYFRKIYTNKNNTEVYENLRNIPSLIPLKSEMINLKIKRNYLFTGLRFLFYIGLPKHERLAVWERILDVEKLINLTKESLKQKGKLFKEENSENQQIIDEQNYDLKVKIYEYLKKSSKDNTQFNINFSLIENDLNFLTHISDSEFDFNVIKDIAKAFFIWAELNITTDSYVAGNATLENKFVYFFGILKIIQKLYSVFKNECSTFWVIVGFSQILELFYQSNPLYNEEMSYTKMYVLITKLVMENNLKNLNNKFEELGFPIEYFFAKLVPTLYSDLFSTEIFMRLLDIIIFEAALKTNSNDRYDYLRVICTIPLTLIKFNEKKILECRSVKEMELIFEDMNYKALNHQKFLEALRENRGKFFEMKNFLERFVDINENTSWEIKRQNIQDQLDIHFEKVLGENKKFLKNFDEKKISITEKFISSLEKETKNKLKGVKRIYSTNDEDHEEEIDLNHLQLDSQGEPVNRFGVYFMLTNFYSYDAHQPVELTTPERLTGWTEFKDQVIYLDGFKDRRKSPTIKVELDHKNYTSGTNVKEPYNNIVSISFPEKLPTYLNILLKNQEDTLIGQYALDIKKIDIMRPLRIKLESMSQSNKTVIEICLIKYSLERVSDEVTDLFSELFNAPSYVYNTELDSVISSTPKYKEEDLINLNANINSTTENFLNRLMKMLKIKEKFIYEEFKKYLGANIKTQKEIVEEKKLKQQGEVKSKVINPKLQEIIKVLFTDKNLSSSKMQGDLSSNYNLINEWLENNDVNLEEILYSIILVDPSSISIYEKLKLIYDVAKIKNNLIFADDTLPVSKLKELIFCLYKRYMVYFTKYDVDRLVDYILTGENFLNFRFGGVFKNEKSHLIENIINDWDHQSTSVLQIFKKDEKLYSDIKRHLVQISNLMNNGFNVNSLPTSVLNLISKYIFKEESVIKNGQFDKVLIEYESDLARKIKQFDFTNSKLNETVNFSNLNITTGDPFESLLKYEFNSIETSNSYIGNINFDKFKDVFFNLPFISDLFRASCGFFTYNPTTQSNFIRTFETVKIELSYPDDYVSRNFIFTEYYDENVYENTEEEIYYNMGSLIESSYSIKDVIDAIYSRINHDADAQELKVYLNNPKFITYLVYNKYKNIDEKIRYYDPLYSNSFIRNVHVATPIELKFKLGLCEDLSRVDNKLVVKKNGFFKFNIINQKTNCQWRQCKIKDNRRNNIVKMNSKLMKMKL